MPAALLPSKLPDPPGEYNQAQFNQIVRKIQQALSKTVASDIDHEDQEALDYFMSK